jgi:hypothetical protein
MWPSHLSSSHLSMSECCKTALGIEVLGFTRYKLLFVWTQVADLHLTQASRCKHGIAVLICPTQERAKVGL